MKTKKTFNYVLALAFILSAGMLYAQKTPPRSRPVPHPKSHSKEAKPTKIKAAKANKVQARKVIRRTAVVIHHAQKHVKVNKNFTGDLSRAVAHQRYARRLYAKANFKRAIHQSRVARTYAHKAIQANKGGAIAEAKLTKEEEALMADMPSEEVLIAELEKEEGKKILIDDAKLVDAEDVDLEENE